MSSASLSAMTDTASTMPAPSFVPHHLSTPITLKLTEDNFLLWKQQVIATIHELLLLVFFHHFLDGMNVTPRFLSSLPCWHERYSSFSFIFRCFRCSCQFDVQALLSTKSSHCLNVCFYVHTDFNKNGWSPLSSDLEYSQTIILALILGHR